MIRVVAQGLIMYGWRGGETEEDIIIIIIIIVIIIILISKSCDFFFLLLLLITYPPERPDANYSCPSIPNPYYCWIWYSLL